MIKYVHAIKIRLNYSRRKKWHCQNEDNQSQEVKKEEHIINLVWFLPQPAHNAELLKCHIVHAQAVDTIEEDLWSLLLK